MSEMIPNPEMTLGVHTTARAQRLDGGRVFAALLAAVLLWVSIVSSGPIASGVGVADQIVSVIVRELPGAGDAAERLVRGAGGNVGRHIGIIDGFAAEVPANVVTRLESMPGVHSVTPDGTVRLQHAVDGFDASGDLGSMFVAGQRVVGAADYWSKGYTGKGVGIAMIDSGVVPVDGLTAPGKVINGPDLSFESQAPNLRYLDTYGHGTHMAGIMAGRDDSVTSVQGGNHNEFLGMAPDARIINVKVADSSGAVDVSQVIAAIDWVVQHRNDAGLNIRVLNLSFGTDGEQNYRLDPLAYAAEVAWRKGIAVVVAAGNGGFGSDKLNNPAYDPFVIAVGGADGNGTPGKDDDTIPEWSSCGDGSRNPDLIAPGTSIVSLRAPGSRIDQEHQEGYVNQRFFRGSGTSQAAALVSGAAALIFQQRPSLTPNQLKKLLTRSATKLPAANSVCQGAGMVNLRAARDMTTPGQITSRQTYTPSTGLGSLDGARGSMRLVHDGVELSREQDIFGNPWNASAWAAACLSGTSWSGGAWNGATWSGSGWTGTSWTGKTWSGATWSGNTWSGTSWHSITWSGATWSGNTWSGNTWSGNTWSGNTWSGNTWSGSTWSSGGWG